MPFNLHVLSERLLAAPRVSALALCLGISLTATAGAQTRPFPNRPIHLIVPLGAGSSTDIVARAVANEMSKAAGQPVLVENKPGAEGLLGARTVVASPPDGYTVLLTSSTHVINTHLYKDLGFDPIQDFVPVTPLVEFPMFLYVNASSPLRTVEDLVRRARQEPGTLTIGSASSTQRLMGEMFKQKADVRLVNVPYRATAAALTDLAGGSIDAMFTDTASASAQREAGKIRALGVGGFKRSDAMPNVPTLDEAGVKGYDLVGSWFGVWVPAKTPQPVVARLHELFSAAVKTQPVKDVMAASGIQPLQMSPDEFYRFQLSETEKLGRVVKGAGIEPQ
jgi:tripartite-type tricarboxylate transporter receptor subunit TctC